MSFTLKITLLHFKPKIWREFEVPNNITLNDLHKIIQIVMGWENCHLYQFIINNKFFSSPSPDGDDFGMETVDDSKAKLSKIIIEPKTKFIYEYDFGDSWGHEIKVLNIDTKKIDFPVCLKGENSCPPEDCGGTPGYENMLEIIKDKKHEEYKDTIEWLGEDFDPKFFDLEIINEELKEYKSLESIVY